MTTPYLIAHVVNAISAETAEVELEIATKDHEGRWRLNDGQEVWPFLWQPLFEIMADGSPVMYDDWFTVPEGWINHLHELAAKQAARSKALIPVNDKGELADILGLLKKEPPMKRRVL